MDMQACGPPSTFFAPSLLQLPSLCFHHFPFHYHQYEPIDTSPPMEAKTLEGKRTMKEKASLDNEEDVEDEMEEEDGFGGSADDERKKVVGIPGRRGSNGGVGGGGVSPPSCQVEKCGADLTEAKRYHRRHKVCEIHAKAPAVVVAGLRQRFCQQCSRFHELSEFDDSKRSCRRRLAGHNERRRKNSAESLGEGSSRKGISPQLKESSQCRQADDRVRFQVTLPGNSTYKRSQIR